MFITQMGEEVSRLTRVVTNEAMDPDATAIVMSSYSQAAGAYAKNSEAAFWAARSGCYDAMNAARIIDIVLAEDPSEAILNEKERITSEMNDFRNRAPFEDGGGHHGSTVEDTSNILEHAFQEVIEITDTPRKFCIAAVKFWAMLNSIRATEGLPKK